MAGVMWACSAEASSSAGVCGEIRTAYARLTRTERRVADVILADPNAALETATAQLALQAGVSQPQVIRFCRAVGFEGLTSFKRALAGSLALSQHGLERGSTHPVLAHSITALARMDAQRDAGALALAAEALAQARAVDVWAEEPQRPLADLAVRALWRLGLHARPALAGDVMASSVDSVCLLLGAGPAARAMAIGGDAAGQTVIVLCDSLPGDDWPASTIQLCTGPEPEDTPALLALQMLHLLLGEVRRLDACNTRAECQIPHTRSAALSYT